MIRTNGHARKTTVGAWKLVVEACELEVEASELVVEACKLLVGKNTPQYCDECRTPGWLVLYSLSFVVSTAAFARMTGARRARAGFLEAEAAQPAAVSRDLPLRLAAPWRCARRAASRRRALLPLGPLTGNAGRTCRIRG